MSKPTLTKPRGEFYSSMRGIWMSAPMHVCGRFIPRRLECVSKARTEARSYQDGYLAGHADAWAATGGVK